MTLPIFLSRKSSLQRWIDRALLLVDRRPELFDEILNKVDTIPAIANQLEANDITLEEFTAYINRLKNDPELMVKEVDKAVEMSGRNILFSPPHPLGFSGQPGCLIAFFIILPVLIMIATMIATFTILTCLNINDCFAQILGGILEAFAQGLTPPDYEGLL
jgi:hypothetical protein